MDQKFFFAAIFTVTGALAASPASATIFDITFSAGPMTDGAGSFGLFLGDTLHGTVTFDDTLAAPLTALRIELPTYTFTQADVTYSEFFTLDGAVTEWGFNLNYRSNLSDIFSDNTAGLQDSFSQYIFCNDCVSYASRVASSPAPEPASWAMMLAGFGAIGGALRSGRKVAFAFG